MGGFRANTNRCGVKSSLAGGLTLPTWFVGLRGDEIVHQHYRQDAVFRKTDFEKSTTTCLSTGNQCPRRGPGRYGRPKGPVKVSFFRSTKSFVTATDAVDIQLLNFDCSSPCSHRLELQKIYRRRKNPSML
jgi:hypothetical protein